MHVSADAKYNLFHCKLTAYERRSTTTEMEIFQTLHKSKPTASGLDSLPACCLVWQHRLLISLAVSFIPHLSVKQMSKVQHIQGMFSYRIKFLKYLHSQ